MVIVSILPYADFGPNDHREDVPYLIYLNMFDVKFSDFSNYALTNVNH